MLPIMPQAASSAYLEAKYIHTHEFERDNLTIFSIVDMVILARIYMVIIKVFNHIFSMLPKSRDSNPGLNTQACGIRAAHS